ncbi:MAG: ABC transporter ATP-binding protein [Verrucomicrobia bacterium]|nr:ABC transporter ATP-binding protein [Verrucomicrobiota bacterium]
MSYLRLENVSKCFSGQREEKVTALRNVSFSLEINELLVLVGPSGCGKTTTLRLVAGLETPDAGKILLDGKVLNSISPESRDVSMVFQTPALFPHLTVSENIGLGLKLRKTSSAEIQQHVLQAAEILGLQDKLNRRPQELSGGEAQRVALGRALVRQPKLFLLDEPLSNLDPITRKQLRREILCLHQKLGIPMIYVTHDHHEAFALGHRVAVMNHGELQQIGTPEEIKRSPANQFVADFVGDEFT